MSEKFCCTAKRSSANRSFTIKLTAFEAGGPFPMYPKGVYIQTTIPEGASATEHPSILKHRSLFKVSSVYGPSNVIHTLVHPNPTQNEIEALALFLEALKEANGANWTKPDGGRLDKQFTLPDIWEKAEKVEREVWRKLGGFTAKQYPFLKALKEAGGVIWTKKKTETTAHKNFRFFEAIKEAKFWIMKPEKRPRGTKLTFCEAVKEAEGVIWTKAKGDPTAKAFLFAEACEEVKAWIKTEGLPIDKKSRFAWRKNNGGFHVLVDQIINRHVNGYHLFRPPCDEQCYKPHLQNTTLCRPCEKLGAARRHQCILASHCDPCKSRGMTAAQCSGVEKEKEKEEENTGGSDEDWILRGLNQLLQDEIQR